MLIFEVPLPTQPKRTKIVCTMGPACADKEVLRGLVRAGMDVARLNFAHGSREDHLRFIRWIRELAEEENRNLAILQDLPGPKLRTGDLAPGLEAIELRRGAEITLTVQPVAGTAETVFVDYPNLPLEIEPGQAIYLSDGRIHLEALETTSGSVRARVLAGGRLPAHQGVNLPGARLGLPSLSGADIDHLRFGLENGVDWVGLSFVRSPEDLLPARRMIDEAGGGRGLIAKIETAEGAAKASSILEVADGLMVARGDLGIEVPLETVPFIQKELIDQAVAAGKPVITATQMLESMINSPRPTRAEVSDVANAIVDGSDAVMLSGETAVGRYPEAAVSMMAGIAREAENALPYRLRPPVRREGGVPTEELIGYASAQAAHELDIGLIVTATTSGSTARRIARHRPRAEILALTSDPAVARRLALTWGVRAEVVREFSSADEIFSLAKERAERMGVSQAGGRIVVTAGIPVRREGTTNLLHVLEIGG